MSYPTNYRGWANMNQILPFMNGVPSVVMPVALLGVPLYQPEGLPQLPPIRRLRPTIEELPSMEGEQLPLPISEAAISPPPQRRPTTLPPQVGRRPPTLPPQVGRRPTTLPPQPGLRPTTLPPPTTPEEEEALIPRRAREGAIRPLVEMEEPLPTPPEEEPTTPLLLAEPVKPTRGRKTTRVEEPVPVSTTPLLLAEPVKPTRGRKTTRVEEPVPVSTTPTKEIIPPPVSRPKPEDEAIDRVIEECIEGTPTLSREQIEQNKKLTQRVNPELTKVTYQTIRYVTTVKTNTQVGGLPIQALQFSTHVSAEETPNIINALIHTETPGTYKPSDFQIVRRLGAGAYGEVFEVKNIAKGTTVVLKVIPKETSIKEQVDREVMILKHLQKVCKQYILCFIDYLEDNQYYYIVTEFLGDYITLEDYIRQRQGVSTETSDMIAYNLIEGLKEIHRQNVAHRDIKPANIMINSKTLDIKYIDFGVSCLEQQCNTTEIAGSPIYMAPEVILGTVRRFTRDSLMKADLWSLGMTLFELVKGQPFNSVYFTDIFIPCVQLKDPNLAMLIEDWQVDCPTKLERLYDKFERAVLKSDQPLPLDKLLPPNVSPYLESVISNMLDKNPNNRKFP